MKFEPHEYQQRAIDFIISHPAAGLFLDMGLGKTVITLTAVQQLMYERFEIQRVLVIAPLRVAWDTWTRECDKWDHLKSLRVSRVLGSSKARIRAMQQNADIYVTNRENVVWLVDWFSDIGEPWPFDMIVIDELSSFKSNDSKRFKALKRVRPAADRVVGLTGTPASNGLMDLWAEMYLLDRGERLGKTITGYRNNYFRPGWTNAGIVYTWNPLPRSMEAITKRIADITMSMKAADYLQLPERIDSTVSVHMDDKTRSMYDEMERQYLLELEEGEVTAMTAAAVMTKLLQLSNGFAYTDDKVTARLHDLKIEALKEIIEQSDSPVLVFYSFVADRDIILDKVKSAEELTTKNIADWNNGKIPVLVTHPASAGYGLNLQEGGHVIVWYGLPWSLEQYQQANARLYRQGQTKPVLVYRLLTEGTVDSNVAAKLEQKDITQSALLEVLKARREKSEC